MVYEPREDSFFMAEWVERLVSGRVLDMGCGTGILSLTALKKAEAVTCVDIDPEVIKHMIDFSESQKLTNMAVVHSDLFAKVKGKYDWIIFNPPYLPSDPRVPDVALDGGPNGWEVIARFVQQLPRFLKKNGCALLLFSSLTNQLKVNECIRRHRLNFEQIDKLGLDFEELYLYKLWRRE